MWPFSSWSQNKENKKGNNRKERARHILEQMASRRVPLGVTFPDYAGNYNTYLLKMDTNQNPVDLILDELLPKQINTKIQPGQVISVKASLLGVPYQFQSQITAVESSGKTPWFRARMPDYVIEDQSRAAYRVAVDKIETISATLSTTGRTSLKGIVNDLSASGMNLSIETPTGSSVNRGDQFESCTIESSHGDTIRCRVEVKHVERDSVTGHHKLGCQFKRFEQFGQKALEKLVARLQRKERRQNLHLKDRI